MKEFKKTCRDLLKGNEYHEISEDDFNIYVENVSTHDDLHYLEIARLTSHCYWKNSKILPIKFHTEDHILYYKVKIQ